MATKKQAAAPESESKELVAFVEIMEPTAGPKARDVIVSVVKGFLASLDQRDIEAKARADSALADPDLFTVWDDKTQSAVVRNQSEADLCGEIANRLAGASTEIEGSWDKETAFFHRFHKTLTERRGRYQRVLNGRIAKLKEGARLWLLKERARVAEQERKANEKIQKFDTAAPPVSFDKPSVAGMSGRAKWRYRVPDHMALVKAVARGKAPIEILQINDRWLDVDVGQHHDRAIAVKAEGKNGKERKFLYEGTVEVFEDVQMARR